MDQPETRADRPLTIREKTARFLDLPAEGAAGAPRAALTGDRELFLEGYRDIQSYGRAEICVDGGPWMLRIVGRDLEIKAIRAGQLRIFGRVDRLELV